MPVDVIKAAFFMYSIKKGQLNLTVGIGASMHVNKLFESLGGLGQGE